VNVRIVREMPSHSEHWLQQKPTTTDVKLVSGTSSLAINTHVAKDAVQQFIAIVANATCDAELYTYMSMDLDTQYLPLMKRAERLQAATSMQRDFSQVIDAQLQVAVIAGLMHLGGSTGTGSFRQVSAKSKASEKAKEAFLLFCATPQRMRDYACSLVDGKRQGLNAPIDLGLLLGLGTREEQDHAGKLADILTSVSWQGMSLTGQEASEYPDAHLRKKLDERVQFCKTSLKSRRQRFAPQLRLPFESESQWWKTDLVVDVRWPLLQLAQASIEHRLCWQVMPWISTHLHLNRTQPEEFKLELRRQIQQWQQSLLREALGCGKRQLDNWTAHQMDSSMFNSQLESIPAHARRWLGKHASLRPSEVTDHSRQWTSRFNISRYLFSPASAIFCLFLLMLGTAFRGASRGRGTRDLPLVHTPEPKDCILDVAE